MWPSVADDAVPLVWPARPTPPLLFIMLSFTVYYKTQNNNLGRGQGSSWPDYRPTIVCLIGDTNCDSVRIGNNRGKHDVCVTHTHTHTHIPIG